ncbi:hypothetical protein [Thalassospira sp. MIT1370]
MAGTGHLALDVADKKKGAMKIAPFDGSNCFVVRSSGDDRKYSLTDRF